MSTFFRFRPVVVFLFIIPIFSHAELVWRVGGHQDSKLASPGVRSFAIDSRGLEVRTKDDLLFTFTAEEIKKKLNLSIKEFLDLIKEYDGKSTRELTVFGSQNEKAADHITDESLSSILTNESR